MNQTTNYATQHPKKHIGFSDRAAGVMVGLACGDALGAAYEFGPAIPTTQPIGMIGGGPFDWQPGEFTDDTSMAMPIAQEIIEGAYLRDSETLGRIVAAWQDWALAAPDVGVQTRSVLSTITTPTEAEARRVSEEHHNARGRSGGNGSLMRTAPVALAFLHDATGLTEAATRIAQLTHWEPASAEACVLWCHAIRHAVVTGELDIRIGLDELSPEAAIAWDARIDQAETSEPADFISSNGWVVSAFQGAWSALFHATKNGERFEQVIERAVRGGGDTDTVAAIAGGLAGAYFGVTGIPAKFKRIVHGWPGVTYRDLYTIGVLAAQDRTIDSTGKWPLVDRMPGTYVDALVPHPHDDGVLMGTLTSLENLPADVDVVVSMCRVGANQVPGIETIEFWLIDEPGKNLDVEFVLTDAANTIAALRAEDKKVVVHCVSAHNRTPAAAVAYSVLHCFVPFEQAWHEVREVLPEPHYNADFYEALSALR